MENSSMARMVVKLKRLARELTQWWYSKTLRTAKDKILEQLLALDALEEVNLLDKQDRGQRAATRKEFNEILLKEEIYRKQRSGERWVKEDRTTF